MKIGFLFNDNFIDNVDFSDVYNGNPGCGGAEYQMSLLFSELAMSEYNEIYVFHYNKSVILPNSVNEIIINDLNELTNYDQMIIVVNLTNELKSTKLNDVILKSNHAFVIWVHCRLNTRTISLLSKEKNVRKIVFVSPLELNLIEESVSSNKATTIFNMIPKCDISSTSTSKDNTVVYVGNISRYKGFINFLKQWKYIIDCVNNAQLYVIGNGLLYNRNNALSVFKLCKPDYEKEIYDVLTNDNIMESVHFLGLMGSEKKHILSKAKLGIITNQNVETFCITALEYQQYGVPVLALDKDGLRFSVNNGVSGLLCNSFIDMRNKAIDILQDKYNFDFNNDFLSEFYVNKIIEEWNELFYQIDNNF